MLAQAVVRIPQGAVVQILNIDEVLFELPEYFGVDSTDQ